LDRFPAE